MDKLGALKSDYDFVGNGRQYGRKRWEPVPEEDRKHELFYVTYSRYVLRGGFDVADGWLRTKGLTDSQIDRYRERWKDRNKEKAS